MQTEKAPSPAHLGIGLKVVLEHDRGAVREVGESIVTEPTGELRGAYEDAGGLREKSQRASGSVQLPRAGRSGCVCIWSAVLGRFSSPL